jgi:prepilin-type N-terminal cleavage/methylation domain-containing protein
MKHRRIITQGLKGRRQGFTLVEVLVASAIVGIMFVCLLEAFRVGLTMLEHSQRLTIASSLAEEVHQMTLTLPLADPSDALHWGLESGETAAACDDVDDLDGQTFSPPVKADGTPIAGLAQYAQRVTVVSVSDANYNQVVANGASTVYRVTVVISRSGADVCEMSWLIVGSQ